jgi:hypothetical protein
LHTSTDNLPYHFSLATVSSMKDTEKSSEVAYEPGSPRFVREVEQYYRVRFDRRHRYDNDYYYRIFIRTISVLCFVVWLAVAVMCFKQNT